MGSPDYVIRRELLSQEGPAALGRLCSGKTIVLEGLKTSIAREFRLSYLGGTLIFTRNSASESNGVGRHGLSN